MVFKGLSVTAQNVGLIEEIPMTNHTFSAEETASWSFWNAKNYTVNQRLVQIGSLSNYLGGNVLSFTLPGSSQMINATGLYISQANAQEYTWMGNISNNGGYVSFSVKDSMTFGWIRNGNTTYILPPLSKTSNALIEVNPASFVQEEIIVEDESGNTGPEGDCKLEDCQAVITISVVVTPEAVASMLAPYSGYNTQTQQSLAAIYLGMGLHSVNFALLASGVVGKSVRFKTRYMSSPLQPDPVPPTREAYVYNLDRDINLLRGGAGSIRNLDQSDLVILLTNDRYGPFKGGASTGGDVAIVSAEQLVSPTFTFAHEFGHLVDARHHRESLGGDEPDNEDQCFYGFVVGGDQYTIMCGPVDPTGKFLMAYSNPATGTGTEDNNNAGHMSQTMCKRPSFYKNVQEASLTITGPELIPCKGIYTYNAVVTPSGPGIPGNGPFHYSWTFSNRKSFNVIKSPIMGNGSSITINTELPPYVYYRVLYLHVTVMSSDGVMLTDVIEIQKQNCDIQDFTTNVEEGNEEGMKVVPNPAIDYVDISVESLWQQDLPFVVKSSFGQILKTGIIPAGQSVTSLPLDLPGGIYQISVNTPSGPVTRKVLFLHH